MEEFRPVKGFPDYAVSNHGELLEIASGIKTFGQKNFQNGICGTYLRNKFDPKKFCLLHRLVCEAFIPNLDGSKYVKHKDNNKSNNNVDNLIWCNRTKK